MTNGVNRNNLGATANWVYTPSASTVVDVAGGGNNNLEGNILTPVALAFTPSSVGLPAYMDTKAGPAHALPIMSFCRVRYPGPIGPRLDTLRDLLDQIERFTHIRGAHTLRAGIDVRDHRRSGGDPGITSGSFNFTNAFTCQQDDCLTAGNIGHSWAAFLMGLPVTSSEATNATYALSNPYVGWYAQDNWRLSSKLSRELRAAHGIRVRAAGEVQPLHCGLRPGRVASDHCAGAGRLRKIPDTRTAGIRIFRRGRIAVYGSWHGGQPLSWRPVDVPAAYRVRLRAHPKTTLRGGYGVYYDTLNAQNQSPDQSGFSLTTTNSSSNDFGQTWLSGDPRDGISPLTNPFPLRSDGTRFDPPVGSALGLLAKDGNGWTFLDPEFQRAREQRWRLEMQRQFGEKMVAVRGLRGHVREQRAPDQKAGRASRRNTGISRTPATIPSPRTSIRT